MIKLLIDGVFFQVNNTGIARVWRSLIDLLSADDRFDVYVLDRGNVPEISGVHYLPFPKSRFQYCPAESMLIQQMCDHYEIDVFSSTYYTTPMRTPMLLVVYDMIPELFDFDLSQRAWMEKSASISYAQRYLCISHNTRNDLLALYPEIPPERVSMAYCGVDESTFHQRSDAEVEAFRAAHGLERPYFLFVGSRVQHNGYKNSGLFFEALARMGEAQFDVFCAGGEPEIEPQILKMLPAGVRCRRVLLSDDELALAYAGALALVYPSLYEGFGMPVIEAMASGCPVITTSHGSLAEAAGDAALLVGGASAKEMEQALSRIQDPALRASLRARGLQHARNFRWQDMADQLATDLVRLFDDARTGTFDEFFEQWQRLRRIQADVDYT